MDPVRSLLIGLFGLNGIFAWAWAKDIWAARKLRNKATPATDARFPNGEQLSIGFLTNFFDCLGIGSYAPTTSWFKIRKIVNDRVIPGTMTIGHNLPTTVETVIYWLVVPVDPTTLFSLIGASVAGAWIGAGIVAKLPKRKVQLGMGCALAVAAVLLFLKATKFLPGGGTAIGVTGTKLLIAVGVHFVLGALMTIGIGMYAPCMITVFLLGMNPKAAYPIMTGSCAFLMPVAALPFIKEKSYSMRPALGLTLAGIPGVLAAAWIVKEMNITYVLWGVIGIVLYTSIAMLRSAFKESAAAGTAGAGEPAMEVEA